MTSPPRYPLINAEPPFLCVLREGDQLVHDADTSSLAEILAHKQATDPFELVAFSSSNTVSRKRPADDAETTDPDFKKRLPATAMHTSTTDNEQIVELNNRDEDLQMLDTPDEEDDNNLANQLNVRDAAYQMPPPQTGVAHGEATNELPLPSPSASPKQASALDEYTTVRELLPQQTDSVMSTESIISSIDHFSISNMTQTARNNLAFRLIRKADRSTLSDLLNSLNNALKRDLITSFPPEIVQQVIFNLDARSLSNFLLVSKRWNKLVTQGTWKEMLLRDGFVNKDELEDMASQSKDDKTFFQKLYTKRSQLFRNWVDPNFEPRRITVPGHGANVVTCLQFDDEKIITGADDKMINIYNTETGDLLRVLQGHEGGVWALKYIGDQIVSGSTDRTVRVWNIKTGKCTHVFRGHTSTIRCMDIVTDDEGQRFIVTGSRDNTLHVWKLPDADDDGSDFDENAAENPYFVTVLRGHTQSVRAVTGHGNIIVSGSYDHTVRVWDLKKRETVHVLTGHTDRIYSTVFDLKRNRCISASMDSTIKVWDLSTGECIANLTKHTSLVGLLALSSSYLVSAAADGTLRGWDPEKYENKFVLHQDNHAAITTFHSTPNFLVSGSEGQFNVYDLRNNGKLVRSNLLPDAGPIWSAKFNDSKCVVAVERNTHSFIEILDFSKGAW
ncbi:CYFA0S13e00606g1_1 [Cyberlindnera fabianii]|uniref:CYFA0S13e00606g1_1 n=1 Tax=Cyberlindnera fabianii TaxID=36022 RepID=A0A061B7R8_CYBFA|nr:CYFA0S13e00606g1_1 [Cyberlindnera fabianii]